jgi:hypothetical protein
MSGAPALKAVRVRQKRGSEDLPLLQVIAQQEADPVKNAVNPKIRNEFASDVRLLQVDFAVRDDRAPIGWAFGTFMYSGNSPILDVRITLHLIVRLVH